MFYVLDSAKDSVAVHYHFTANYDNYDWRDISKVTLTVNLRMVADRTFAAGLFNYDVQVSTNYASGILAPSRWELFNAFGQKIDHCVRGPVAKFTPHFEERCDHLLTHLLMDELMAGIDRVFESANDCLEVHHGAHPKTLQESLNKEAVKHDGFLYRAPAQVEPEVRLHGI